MHSKMNLEISFFLIGGVHPRICLETGFAEDKQAGRKRPCLVHLHTVFEPLISPSSHRNCLYTGLSANITHKFEFSSIKFHKSLSAETEKLEGSEMWVYKTGPCTYTLANRLFQGCQTQILSRANDALDFGLEGHTFLKDLVMTYWQGISSDGL